MQSLLDTPPFHRQMLSENLSKWFFTMTLHEANEIGKGVLLPIDWQANLKLRYPKFEPVIEPAGFQELFWRMKQKSPDSKISPHLLLFLAGIVPTRRLAAMWAYTLHVQWKRNPETVLTLGAWTLDFRGGLPTEQGCDEIDRQFDFDAVWE